MILISCWFLNENFETEFKSTYRALHCSIYDDHHKSDTSFISTDGYSMDTSSFTHNNMSKMVQWQ